MARKIKPPKIIWECKPLEEMSPEERKEAEDRLRSAYDFIFTKALKNLNCVDKM